MSTASVAPNKILEARRWEPWPIGLIVFFTVFVSLVASFITFAVRQQMDLVRPDYYEEEIRYQKQFDRIRRTQALGRGVGLVVDRAGKTLRVSIPVGHVVTYGSGTIQLYRPSDASQDQLVPVHPSAEGLQEVDLTGLSAGLWRAKLRWSAGGQEYSLDESLVIPAGR
jgi:nitrogen fixation protein FixH